MCESIILGDTMIETVGEARKALTVLVFDADMDVRPTPPQDRECLCWLDMEATAESNGYVANNQHGGDPFEWHFIRPS